jgi:hypothetical protein
MQENLNTENYIHMSGFREEILMVSLLGSLVVPLQFGSPR